MKTYTLKTAAQINETNTVWEAFVEYLNSVYFEGAADELDRELIDFEYQSYLECYCR